MLKKARWIIRKIKNPPIYVYFLVRLNLSISTPDVKLKLL
jgi:hypothetical protein